MHTLRPLRILCLAGVLMVLAGSRAPAGDGAEALVRLKRAGFDDQTIEIVVAEKILETAAFSVEELLALKAAGFKPSALQAILRTRSFLINREPVVYGADVKPLRLASVGDLVELKRAGVSDDVIRALVESAAGAYDGDRIATRQMLEGLEIRIDTRSGR